MVRQPKINTPTGVTVRYGSVKGIVFRADIMYNRTHYNLGSYVLLADAVRVYKTAKRAVRKTREPIAVFKQLAKAAKEQRFATPRRIVNIIDSVEPDGSFVFLAKNTHTLIRMDVADFMELTKRGPITWNRKNTACIYGRAVSSMLLSKKNARCTYLDGDRSNLTRSNVIETPEYKRR